ncbi:MAG: hypothetical protein QNJ30_03495 [Kiloniellales bacterium]|nr:hypothetical protein [Kiloniellales bacterium]
MKEKAVIVHCLEDARIALAAAEAAGCGVVLASAPGAAGYAGVLWFRELLRASRAERPGVPVTGLLDCGDKPGLVLAALDQGLPALRFTGSRKAAKQLAEICEREGIELVTGRLKALDLAAEAAPDVACRAWLSGP